MLPDGPEVPGKVEATSLEDQHQSYPLVVQMMPTIFLSVRFSVALHVIYGFRLTQHKTIGFGRSLGVASLDKAEGVNVLRICLV